MKAPNETPIVSPLPDDAACDATDRQYIERTYELARAAVKHGNHPFGALLVKDGKVVLEFENDIYTTRDLTRHAEAGLISEASKKFGHEALAGATLYASTEPCIMCCGAIRWAGITKVVYGTTSLQMSREIALVVPALKSGARPTAPLEVREVFARTEPSVKVFGPLLEAEGLAIHATYWANDPVIKSALAASGK